MMFGASLSFAVMGVCVKYVADEIPTGEIVLFRSGIATLVAGAAGLSQGRKLLGVAHRMLVTRSLVGLASMYAYFMAIAWLPLGDAVLITNLSPLIVAAMAPFILGEKSTRVVWLALAFGFAGVFVVEDPSGEISGPGLLAALASAGLAASAYVSVKVLSKTDSPVVIVVWFSAIATVVSAIEVAVRGVWVTPPSLEAFAALVGTGITAAVAQILMTRAYAASQATRVAVFGYATPLLAYVLGQAMLREPIGWRGLAGCALLVCAGVIVTFGSAPPEAPAQSGG